MALPILQVSLPAIALSLLASLAGAQPLAGHESHHTTGAGSSTSIAVATHEKHHHQGLVIVGVPSYHAAWGYPTWGRYSLGVPYSPYYFGPYALPPLVMPTDALFGPLAVQRFVGVANPQPVMVAPRVARGAGDVGKADPARERKVKATNAATKARAGKFMQFGDVLFGKQKFHQAVDRYRTAAEIAPDMPETFLRQAFAMVALGQYDNAAKLFRRGLKVRPNWLESGFRLDQIYGDSKLAKNSHREALAGEIEANPQNADLLMVLGLVLFFDGERERARPFFEHAAQLGGNEDRLLDAFLTPQPGDPAPGNPAPNGAVNDGDKPGVKF